MPQDPTVAQRPYDIELREHSQELYATHLAVNRGAAYMLDWLLTLRGGISAMTALQGHATPKTNTSTPKPSRAKTREQITDPRRAHPPIRSQPP